MELGKNLKTLTEAGVIPKEYKHLTEAEKAAFERLSDHEVKAIISTKTKLGHEFFSKYAPHGMVY